MKRMKFLSQWPGMLLIALITVVGAVGCSPPFTAESEEPETETVLMLSALFFIGNRGITPTHNNIFYGNESRQWLDIYNANTSSATPVYVWAHQNGSTADNIPQNIIRYMRSIGVSVVSWESIPTMFTTSDVSTGFSDAQLMLSWIRANGSSYGLDTDKIIIGGFSRGSGISWKITHSLDPSIKGAYMYDAIGDSFWSDPGFWVPTDEIKNNSPEVYFTYRLAPGTTDSHDPDNGITLRNRYTALGIGDRFTLVHGLGSSDNPDPWRFLSGFVSSLIQ